MRQLCQKQFSSTSSKEEKKQNTNSWMGKSDSFVFPDKQLGELLKTYCHGDNLATLHLS